MKRVTGILTVVVCIVLLAGCTKNEAANSGTLKNGSYSATYDQFEDNGWKAFLKIEVKDSKITESNFGYVDKDGKLNIESSETERLMKDTVGIGPVEYIPIINGDIVGNQTTEIDAISGATGSVATAKELLAALLEKAEQGDSSEIVLELKN